MDPLDMAVLALRVAMVLLLYAFILAVLRAARATVEGAEREPAPARSASGHRPGALVLTVVDPGESGLATGESFEVRGEAIVGRAAGADIRLPDSSVSSRHGRFQPRSRGWVYQDLGSTNGSAVDGKRADGPVFLRPGARVLLGRVALQADPVEER